jgi:hypothetical protein
MMVHRPWILGALLIAAAPVAAQNSAGSSAATPNTGDVSASTWGSGTSTPDSVGVSGGGDATAANGGTATSDSTAKFNDNVARQRSVATARDEDERARSRTMTMAKKDGDVRSRSMSIYKQRGEKPVITRDKSSSSDAPTTADAPPQ